MDRLKTWESLDNCERLDTYLSSRFPDFSRTYFHKLFKNKKIQKNGQYAKKAEPVFSGDVLSVEFFLEETKTLEPEKIPLEVLYEDESILAINKPAGMVVHPACGNWSGTVANALVFRYQDAPIETDSGQVDALMRPGIVHRLDKETSGVLLIGKTRSAQEELVQQFAKREIQKTYLAVTHGFPGEGVLQTGICRDPRNRQQMKAVLEGGKEAVTEYCTLEKKGNYSLVQLMPKTGRTHQLRVHLSYLRTPVVGDKVYAPKHSSTQVMPKRHLLHAYRLKFVHPKSKILLELIAPLPEEFKIWGWRFT